MNEAWALANKNLKRILDPRSNMNRQQRRQAMRENTSAIKKLVKLNKQKEKES